MLQRFQGGVSGIKNIPGDYQTIGEAYEHISCVGLSGPIVLELNNNYDTLQEFFPIKLSGGYNFSSTNNLTIRPAAQVSTPLLISAHPADSSAFVLSNVAHITIDGRPGGIGDSCMFRIRSLKNTIAALIITDGATNNCIRNVKFELGNLTSQLSTISLRGINNVNSSIKANLITKCKFDGLYTNSSTNSAFIHVRGGVNNIIDSTIIDDNLFYNNRKYALFIERWSNNCYIKNNSFFHTQVAFSSSTCVSTDSTGGDLYVSDNYFGGSTEKAQGNATQFGNAHTYVNVYQGSNQSVYIDRNVFRNAKSSSFFQPIYLESANARIGTNGGNLIGDTLALGSLEGNDFRGITIVIRNNTTSSSAKVENNTVSSIKASDFRGVYFYSSHEDPSYSSTISVSKNSIGHPLLPASIRSISISEMYGIHAGGYNIKGIVQIDSNFIGNFSSFNTDSTKGAMVKGIWVQGVYYNTENATASTTRIKQNIISNLHTGGYPDGTLEGITCWANTNLSYLFIEDNEISHLYSYGDVSTDNNAISILGKATIQRNKIYGLKNLQGHNYVYGIYYIGAIICKNNAISLGCANQGGFTAHGIFGNASIFGPSSFYNNSIHVTARYPNCMHIGDSSVVKNNILSAKTNLANGSGQVLYCPTNCILGNNIYALQSTNINSPNPYSFTIPDTSSRAVLNAQFVNECGDNGTWDMHINPYSLATNFGKANAIVTDDIDGNARATTGNIDAGCYQANIIQDTLRPSIFVTGGTSVCRGEGSLKVPYHNGWTYQWQRNGVNVGTNSNIIIPDSSGNYSVMVTNTYGTITSLNTVPITVNPVYEIHFFDTICEGTVLQFSGQLLTQAGVYTSPLQSIFGCDSNVIMHLTTKPVNNSIHINGNTVTADQSNASYQWVDCTTNQWISGATSQSYNGEQNGAYRCIITTEECTYGTECTSLIPTGINQLEVLHISIFPNPAYTKCTLHHNGSQTLNCVVVNSNQQIVLQFEAATGSTDFNLYNFNSGIYYLLAYSKDHVLMHTDKVIKY